jgi:hypothetical protein
MASKQWRIQDFHQAWAHYKPGEIFIKIGCAAGWMPRRVPRLRDGWVRLCFEGHLQSLDQRKKIKGKELTTVTSSADILKRKNFYELHRQ